MWNVSNILNAYNYTDIAHVVHVSHFRGMIDFTYCITSLIAYEIGLRTICNKCSRQKISMSHVNRWGALLVPRGSGSRGLDLSEDDFQSTQAELGLILRKSFHLFGASYIKNFAPVALQ